MTKVCKICKISKPESDFYQKRKNCKKCQNLIRYRLKKEQKKNPEWIEKYRMWDRQSKKRTRGKKDPKFTFIENVRTLVRKSIQGYNYTKNSKTFEILGIDREGFLKYLESQFKEGMSWDNHGLYGWHLDHKIPVSSAKSQEEIILLNHYTNFQPLWAEENLKKGDKIIEEFKNLS